MSKTFTGTARFELIRRLGEGGSGIVYEAFDRRRSSRVALKVLREAEGAPLYRFKREFRTLAEISHPNLVSLDELLTDGWHWFFTMELVSGVPMTTYAKDEDRLRSVLLQLGDALNTIHGLGIVHRDIKPTNVLVTPAGRLVVLDFGLVSERDPHQADEDERDQSEQEVVVLGTPSYMAPEQAGNGNITPAADWYSVGVMLYEALTGVRPFSGSNIDVIEAKRSGRPRPPGEIAPNAPPDLAEFCMKLLDPDPVRRPSGQAVLASVGSAMQTPRDGALTPSRAALVGRESHLQRLAEAFETMMCGQTVVAFVSGLSGMGKTTLVRQFLQTQRMNEPTLLALTSRCYERESMPYKALDPLIDSVAQHLRRLRDIEVARLLPRDAAILARVFPVLLGIEEVRRAPTFAIDSLDSLTLRQRAAAALHDLLFALGIRVPLVLWIDDAQWGDVDSASILQQILLPPKPPLLLIVAYRSEDADEARFLRGLRKVVNDDPGPRVFELEVGPLTYEDAQQLALELTAGSDGNAQRAQTIARESRGNPFFVHELVQHAAVLTGATRLDAVVLDRVAALPAAARHLVTAIALSAQPIPATVAHTAAEVETGDWGLLQLLRASRLIRSPAQADEPTLEPYHDRIREAIVSHLSDLDLQTWHGRMAAAWEQSGRARPETLLAHYLGANDHAKTIEYAGLAAEKAEAALAFDRAADFYGILVALESDVQSRRQWLTRLGDALVNAGRGYDAATAYLKALDVSSGEDSIELERRAAAELIRAGYLDEAAGILERLLPKIGVASPRSELLAVIRLFGYRLLLSLRGTRFRETAEAEIAPSLLRRIDVLSSIAPPLALISLARGSALNLQAAWQALRAGEPRRVVTGLASLAASSAMGGTRTARRSQRLVREAQALAASLNDPWTTARTELAEGIFLKVNGRWKEGVERLESAISLFNACTGVRWEVETAQTLIHDALYWMGEWSRLARELPARRQEAEQRGDLYSVTHVAARLSPVLHMAADRLEQARAEADTGLAQWTKRGFHLQHRWAVCTGIDLDLYSGNAVAAAERLSAAWPPLRAVLFLFQNGRIEMLFYRARIALALVAAGKSSALGGAMADARRLDREGAEWASALAQLIRASVARARGDTASAIEQLERAEAMLRRSDMNHYAAAARFRRGQIAGGAAGEQLMRSGAEWIQNQQITNHERAIDLLAPGPWTTGVAVHG